MFGGAACELPDKVIETYTEFLSIQQEINQKLEVIDDKCMGIVTAESNDIRTMLK